MNIGIICEFNPFHLGHKHLIDSVKKDDDNIICVMSGNFVQRGEFAVYDKFKRTRTALSNGADLVIELPTMFSTLSAEGFCKAGVELLESTGICDEIAFGAEETDINKLKEIALKLQDKDTQELIKSEMKNGVSYPVARNKVLNSDLLMTPNNILAIEYLKATKLDAVAIKRIGKGHDSDDEDYSASQIRKNLNLDEISSMKNCEVAILSKLRRMSKEDFEKIEDVSEGLQNRIVEAVKNATSLDEVYDLIKSKRYTHSRIRRIILRAYLDIYDIPKNVPYIRILGFNEKGRQLLKNLKKNATKPIITKISDCNEDTLPFFEKECEFTNLYNLGYKKPLPCGTEQRSQIVIM